MRKPDLSYLSPKVAALVEPMFDGKIHDIAFDADGTLWSDDIGDAFLKRMDDACAFPSFPKGGAWNAYSALLASKPFKAYEFAATVLAGLSIDTVERGAELLAQDFVLPHLYRPMECLVYDLVQAKQRVWVVSASNVWVVRAGAARLDIPRERVIGVELVNGMDAKLGPMIKHPTPIGPGKAGAMKAAGLLPDLAAGNSTHDFELLKAAKKAFVVMPIKGDGAVQKMSARHGWPIQRV